MSDILKAQYAADIFTTRPEAYSRSCDLGLGGSTHVYEYDGQAVYIPGNTHEEYLAFYEEGEKVEPEVYDDRLELLRIVVEAIIGKNMEGKILKFEEEQRMVWGWASVVTEKGEPVVDRQGDVISPEVMTKAVNEFMEHVRVGKAMHNGEQVGTVVHSLPVTKEIGEALGIHSDREGWIVGYKVYDDQVWNMVKSGELAAFSIGGRATKEEI